MLRYDAHLSDEELILNADGELSARASGRVKMHLAACWTCRTRLKQMEVTIADFVNLYHQSIDLRLPPSAGPRALLKLRLAGLAAEPCPGQMHRLFQAVNVGVVSCILGLVIFVVAGASILDRHSIRTWANLLGDPSEIRSLPYRNITPGATRPVSIGEICTMEHEEVIRPVPATLQTEVYQEYGLRNPLPGEYEVDYLITPGLGGDDQLSNLWPEPYSTLWNARVKDALEEQLHQMVCDKKITLATAQRDIATDWIAAYKKYFRTRTPLSNRTAASAIPYTQPGDDDALLAVTTAR